MRTGIVKVWAGHYGIIEPHGSKKDDPDVFFHVSVMQGVSSLTEGQWVQFEVVPDYVSKYGTLKATRVALCGPKRARSEVEMTA